MVFMLIRMLQTRIKMKLYFNLAKTLVKDLNKMFASNLETLDEELLGF